MHPATLVDGDMREGLSVMRGVQLPALVLALACGGTAWAAGSAAGCERWGGSEIELRAEKSYADDSDWVLVCSRR